MTECNAIKSKLSSNSQNWLEHRVSNKKPKKKKKLNHLNVFKDIDQLIITQVRKQFNDQLYQFNKPILSILTQLNKMPKSSSIQALGILIFHKTPNLSNFSTKIMNITVYQQNRMINYARFG